MSLTRFILIMTGLAAITIGASEVPNEHAANEGPKQAAAGRKAGVHEQGQTIGAAPLVSKFVLREAPISTVVKRSGAPLPSIGRAATPLAAVSHPAFQPKPAIPSVGGPPLLAGHRGANPASIGGSTQKNLKGTAGITGTGLVRKP
jgi:hypothetical protein